MNKWDEIYGPATPLVDLERRIEALEEALSASNEGMMHMIDALRQTNAAVEKMNGLVLQAMIAIAEIEANRNG